jgi:hypothetical protein
MAEKGIIGNARTITTNHTNKICFCGDCGLGIGDWGLGIGDRGLGIAYNGGIFT